MFNKKKSSKPHARNDKPNSRPRTCPWWKRPHLTLERLEERCLPSNFTVINTNLTGEGSLQQAILDANAHGNAFNPGRAPDEIDFNIPGTGAHTIRLVAALPAITDPVILDGYTQPGAHANTLADADDAVLQIELEGTQASFSNGLVITGGGSTVRGLVINRFHQDFNQPFQFYAGGNGILIQKNGGNVIEGNFIGVDPTGSSLQAFGFSSQAGIQVQDSSGNLIGGTTPAARNVVAGHPLFNILLGGTSNGNLVQGNFIGLSAAGNTALGPNSANGIAVRAANNSIGGNDAGAGNVISGNGEGIAIRFGGSGTMVQGNFIGTDPAGRTAIGNGGGIDVDDPDCTIGGAAKGATNLISGNGGPGISVETARLLIQGNLIGTDVTGSIRLGNNGPGISANHSSAITIGGTTTAARNLVSGNASNGIDLVADSSVVQGNYIGTDVSGLKSLPNGTIKDHNGVRIGGSSNLIGGTASGAGNLISGNIGSGISISGNSNMVQGNLVGVNAGGSAVLRNSFIGIQLSGSNDQIGGKTPAARNIVSGNGDIGILLNTGTSNTVQGNFVGTQTDGTSAQGNGAHGIEIIGASDNTIGGLDEGAGNIIAFNAGDGIVLVGDGTRTGNAIESNAIFANRDLGIDLGSVYGPNGVTANDPVDADDGVNHFQNFPVLSAAIPDGGGVTYRGTLNSKPNTSFTLQFFASSAADTSGFGEGQSYLASTVVATDADGNATFNSLLDGTLPSGQLTVTATATDPAGNTSEFSAPVQVVPVATVTALATSSNSSGAGKKVTFTATVTAKGQTPGGSVTFKDGTAILATTAVQDGQAAFSTTALAVGDHTITAVFTGNTGFLSSASTSLTQTVTAGADLAVVASAAPDPVTAGNVLNYFLTIVNFGPDPATAVTLANTLPAGTMFISASPSQGSFTQSENVLTFDLGSLPNHGTANITLAVRPAAAGTIINRTTVMGNENDPDTTNNAVSRQVTVTEAGGTSNHPPSAVADSLSTIQNTAVTFDLVANDSDPDGDTLTIVSVTQPSNGSAAIADTHRVTYTPHADFHGADMFTYSVSDGRGGIAPAAVSVTVQMIHHLPTAVADSAITNEVTAVTIYVLSNDTDADGHVLSVTAVDMTGAHSAVVINADSSLTYTPKTDFNGVDHFSYTVSDGVGGVDQGAVTVTVTAVEDPPRAQDDNLTTLKDVPATLAVLANDTDPDSDVLSVTAVDTTGTHGAITIGENGTLHYVPPAGFTGADSFGYTVSDGTMTSTAAVNVQVVEPGQLAPSLSQDIAAGLHDWVGRLPEWAKSFNLSSFDFAAHGLPAFHLPVVTEALNDLFQLDALLQALPAPQISAAATLDDLIGHLQAIPGLNIDSIIGGARSIPATAGSDLLRGHYTVNLSDLLPSPTFNGNLFNNAMSGVLDKLSAGGNLQSSLSLLSQLAITLSFGVDGGGFFVDDASRLGLHVAGSGSLSGGVNLASKLDVHATGSATADLTVDLRLGQTGKRLRASDLQTSPAQYLVPTAAGTAHLKLNGLKIGPVTMSWEAGFEAAVGPGLVVSIHVKDPTLSGVLTLPEFTVAASASAQAVVDLAGSFNGDSWSLSGSTEAGVRYRFNGFEVDTSGTGMQFSVTVGSAAFHGMGSGKLKVRLGDAGAEATVGVGVDFTADSLHVNGQASLSDLSIGTPALLWIARPQLRADFSTTFSGTPTVTGGIAVSAGLAVLMPKNVPASGIPDGFAVASNLNGSVDANGRMQLSAAGVAVADQGILSLQAHGVSLTLGPGQADSQVIATFANVSVRLNVFPQLPPSRLDQVTITHGGQVTIGGASIGDSNTTVNIRRNPRDPNSPTVFEVKGIVATLSSLSFPANPAAGHVQFPVHLQLTASSATLIADPVGVTASVEDDDSGDAKPGLALNLDLNSGGMTLTGRKFSAMVAGVLEVTAASSDDAPAVTLAYAPNASSDGNLLRIANATARFLLPRDGSEIARGTVTNFGVKQNGHWFADDASLRLTIPGSFGLAGLLPVKAATVAIHFDPSDMSKFTISGTAPLNLDQFPANFRPTVFLGDPAGIDNHSTPALAADAHLPFQLQVTSLKDGLLRVVNTQPITLGFQGLNVGGVTLDGRISLSCVHR